MKRRRLYSVLTALAVCALAPAALKGGVIFSDLGPAGDVYYSGEGFTVAGAAGTAGASYEWASLFWASGSGSLPVTGIDLGVSNVSGPDTFFAGIWALDGIGNPGVQVANAYWTLSTSASVGTCCALVSIAGITDVTLTGGQSYWMILGPLSTSDSSDNLWDFGDSDGARDYSTDGGSTWQGYAVASLGAFDITSSPEPAAWPMLLALAGASLWRRLRKRSAA